MWGVAWSKVLAILAVNRLIEPGSEFSVHRRWFLDTALDALLEVDFSAVSKDRLYRCLDRLLPHKEALFQHLTERWKTLFGCKRRLKSAAGGGRKPRHPSPTYAAS